MDGTILEWSDRAASVFGWMEHEALGQNIGELLGLCEMAAMFSGLESSASAGDMNGQRHEATAKHRAGRFFPVEASASIASFDEREIVVFFHDVSRRRELQAQLLLAQKMQGVGQLAAGIAHEINTPTQYVGDNTRFLQDAFRDIEQLLATLEEGPANVGLDEAAWNALSVPIDLKYLRTEIPIAIEQMLDGIERIARLPAR